MKSEAFVIEQHENELRILDNKDPFNFQPQTMKDKLKVLRLLVNEYRQLVKEDVSKVEFCRLQKDNHDLMKLIPELHKKIDALRLRLSQMVDPKVISRMKDELQHSVSKSQHNQLLVLNHRLQDQVNDLMTVQDQLNSRLDTTVRQLATVSQQRDALQEQLDQYYEISRLLHRFPVRTVKNYTSFSDMWNDKINDPGWHIYLIGGYGVETHLPLVKIGRAKNMKDRFRLYDELEPGYLKDAGQSTFAGRFDLRPGYQFPLGLYRLTDLGIDGNDELYFRMEAVYKAVLRSIFADNCLLGQDGRQLEFFRSDDKSLYEKMTNVFDQVSSLLTNAGADKVQAMLMQYSKDTLVKRLSVEEPVVVLQDWLASL